MIQEVKDHYLKDVLFRYNKFLQALETKIDSGQTQDAYDSIFEEYRYLDYLAENLNDTGSNVDILFGWIPNHRKPRFTRYANLDRSKKRPRTSKVWETNQIQL